MKFNHLNIAILIGLALSLCTVFAVTLSDAWTIRNIYNVFYFAFLNLTLLSFNAFLFGKKRSFIPESVRKPLRITFILAYSAIYLIATFTYATTGQVPRIQTLIFLYGIGPIVASIAVLVFLALCFGLLVLFIHKKTSLKDIRGHTSRKIKLLLIANIILLFLTIVVNTQFLQINIPLGIWERELVAYDEDRPVLEDLFNASLKNEKYNVVFILLESVSAERLGVYGYDRNVTPYMDSLAQKGLIFEEAYSTSTHSDYAQPGLLSSRYIFSSNTRTDYSLGGSVTNYKGDAPRKFVWDVFKENGYKTGYFSSQDDRWQGMDDYLNYKTLDSASYSLSDGETDYGTGFGKKDYDHKTADKAISWMNNVSKEKFFVYLNFQATHYPNVYPENISFFKPDSNPPSVVVKADEEGINRFDSSLKYVDEQVGRILKHLEENGLQNKTVVVITSDHGHDLLNRHNVQGHGNSIYNEELLVPAIAFVPGYKHTVIKERVSQIDFVPTLIDLFGYPMPYEFQGEIMKKGRPIYFVAQSHKYYIGLVDKEIKIILNMNTKQLEAYNLTDDSREIKNIRSVANNDKILKLLLWRHCQIEYYKKEKWKENKQDRCNINNNFKINPEFSKA
ncbi:MAG: sulfatase [Nanoarchaeota archaeon]